MALGSGGEKVSEDELSVRATKNFDYVLAARAERRPQRSLQDSVESGDCFQDRNQKYTIAIGL